MTRFIALATTAFIIATPVMAQTTTENLSVTSPAELADGNATMEDCVVDVNGNKSATCAEDAAAENVVQSTESPAEQAGLETSLETDNNMNTSSQAENLTETSPAEVAD